MILSKAIGQEEDPLEYKESDELSYNDSFIGIEIEYEGIPLSYSKKSDIINRKLWIVKREHSLRNGAELVTLNPLKGSNIIKALKNSSNFFDQAAKDGFVFQESQRCSVHIHLDVRDLSFEEINKLILIYMLFEKCLFEIAGVHRIKNNYCRPLIGSTFSNIYRILEEKTSSLSFMEVVEHQCDKYSALNSKPLTYFGSLEFRHHRGTVSYGDIVKWINLILCLKKFIKEKKSIESLLSNNDPIDIVKEVFSEDYGEELLLSQDLDSNILYSKKAVELIYNQNNLKKETDKILNKKSVSKKKLMSMFIENQN